MTHRMTAEEMDRAAGLKMTVYRHRGKERAGLNGRYCVQIREEHRMGEVQLGRPHITTEGDTEREGSSGGEN